MRRLRVEVQPDDTPRPTLQRLLAKALEELPEKNDGASPNNRRRRKSQERKSRDVPTSS